MKKLSEADLFSIASSEQFSVPFMTSSVLEGVKPGWSLGQGVTEARNRKTLSRSKAGSELTVYTRGPHLTLLSDDVRTHFS